MSSEAAGSSLTEEKIRHYKITAWVVTIAIFLTGVSLAYVQNKVSPVIPVFMDVFSIDMTTAGWLSSVFSIVAMISALPAAWSVDVFFFFDYYNLFLLWFLFVVCDCWCCCLLRLLSNESCEYL